MDVNNSEKIIDIWDRWSQGHPKYDYQRNLAILNNDKASHTS